MATFPMLPLFTDAFLADTGHLSAAETGAYVLLLMAAWRSPGCRLPDNDTELARIARLDARNWRRLKPRVMKFWMLQDGWWTQKRLSKEIVRAKERASRSRKNGANGGRPRERHDCHAVAATACLTPWASNPLENNDLTKPTGFLLGSPKKRTISTVEGKKPSQAFFPSTPERLGTREGEVVVVRVDAPPTSPANGSDASPKQNGHDNEEYRRLKVEAAKRSLGYAP